MTGFSCKLHENLKTDLGIEFLLKILYGYNWANLFDWVGICSSRCYLEDAQFLGLHKINTTAHKRRIKGTILKEKCLNLLSTMYTDS